ncbi:MAG: hypothetical protein GC192_02340 [Bacteroidetes bacterium]|nr:hypothetical protein [Bacteroidota bacterium]
MNHFAVFQNKKIKLAILICLGGFLTSFTILPNANFQELFEAFYPKATFESQPITNHYSPLTMTYDYDAAWREIDSLEQQGLPKTALEKTELLLTSARLENNAAQTVKALIYRGKYQSQLEEEGLAMAINRLEEEATKAEYPVKPILQSILAEMYANYLNQNLWRFQNRTATVEFKPKDFKTWSIEQLSDRSAFLYKASLTDNRLKTTDLGDFKILLTDGRNDEGLRPTLFDFLAHRAIDYFMNERSYLTQPAYKFYIDDAKAFAPAAEFVNWKIETQDTASQKLQTLLLFQDLLRFRLSEKVKFSPSLLDADLKRLSFVYSNSVQDTKDAAYLAALENLRSQYKGNPGEAEVMFQLASYYFNKAGEYQAPPLGKEDKDERKWYYKKASELCSEAMRTYAGSFGDKQCAGLKASIDARSLTLTLEQVNLPGQPFLAKVDYKNTPTVHLKIIRLDDKRRDELEKAKYEPESNVKILNMLKNWPSVKTWSVKLPDDGDFRQHAVEIKIEELPLGTYAVLVADNDAFEAKSNAVAYAVTHVSKLGLWQRQGDNGMTNAVVFDRESGQPLKGVKVDVFVNKYNALTRRYDWKKKGTQETNADGFVNIDVTERDERNLKLVLCTGKDTLDTDANFYVSNYRNDPKPYEGTQFFLDRAIYRPGQTVYFKGISLRYDEKRMPTVIKNREVTVTFLDANYQKVNDLKLRTNDYGTFSGQFTAPRTGLLGQMQIQASIGGQSQSFRVEEYKRPKFEVSFEPVKGSYRLNEEVTVDGKAIAYAGNNIDGAKVSYRVVREVRYPWLPWWYFRWYPIRSESMEITNGEATTDAEGKFKIKFTALPDRSISKEQKPEFYYTVYADVTDITGETQSNETSVSVGYISMKVDVSACGQSLENTSLNLDSLKKFDLLTQNLNGQFEPAKGNLKLELLKSPNHTYLERYWPQPDRQVLTEAEFKKVFPQFAYSNENEPQNWQVERTVFEENWDTEKSKEVILPKTKINAGWYVVTVSTQDKFGEKIEVKKYFSAYDLGEKKLPVPTQSLHLLTGSPSGVRGAFEPGQTANLWFGTTERSLNVLLEIEKDGKMLRRKWLNVKDLQGEQFQIAEEYRGNVSYAYSWALQNRSTNSQGVINVPWSNKDMTIEYGTFRDKLLPGQQEEWVVKIKGPKGDKVAAEMVAGMYDASLDAFAANSWGLNVWPTTWSRIRYNSSGFQMEQANQLAYNYSNNPDSDYRQYRGLNWFNWGMYDYGYAYGGRMYKSAARSRDMDDGVVMMEAAPAPTMDAAEEQSLNVRGSRTSGKDYYIDGVRPQGDLPPKQGIEEKEESKPATDLSQVKVRTNLNETVFFYPNLMTDAEGNVVIKFTMNEALTKWKFLSLATTQDLEVGTTSKEIVTQKDLMVVPNPPRFFREYDEIEFTAKVVNLSKETLNGEYKLELKNALTGDEVFPLNGTNPAMAAILAAQPLRDLKPGESRRLAWRFKVPDVADVPVIEHTVIASAGAFSDAERSAAPVLSNRMLVTETLPLPVRGGETKNFTLNSLKNNNSNTLRHEGMTLEFTQNPAWYAVQALPYLMEYPYECNEQIFSRYYANSLATSVANSHPKIKTIFERWRNYEPDALKSNLSKNQELKTALLEETPWVLNAQSEEQQKQNIALLFDLNRMAFEQEAALKKLQERQLSNGGWGWFPGDRDNWYITQYIVEGLGHLQRLGVQDVMGNATTRQMVESAVRYCDARIVEQYEELERQVKKGDAKWEDDHLNYMVIHYLYARSFFLENNSAQANTGGNFKVKQPISLEQKVATVHAFYIGQAEKYWLNKGFYSEGMLALSLDRNGKTATAQKIAKSLKERSLNNDELGMYWKYTSGWWWYQAPIETQALMIEVFNDVAADSKSVDDLKVWLLKNKQTNHWKTTKATAAAVYALLTSGDNWLLEDQPVTINFGDKNSPKAAERSAAIAQAQKGAEAGTGYFKLRFDGDKVTKDMANVTVTNPNKVVAWGALYWQYFEQLDKIKTFEETPLTIKKQLLLVQNSDKGEVLKPIAEGAKLKVGDKVKVRIELRVDRDMEYVHMKDMRASSFEPINVLSSYKWQGGLGYYESTRDAATNFFFSWLPKGTHVFEYPLRVTYNGDFSNGITTVQCMYAPEFTSHSAGIRLKVE